MALKVYRIAVVGCPRAVISKDGWYEGVGKSCLCNRFIRPEAYIEDHNSLLSLDDWSKSTVHNGDHFIYWGATTKHLHDGTKVRFQIVEQTEFYSKLGDESTETDELTAHPATQDYISRGSALHFRSTSAGKEAYRLKATDLATRRTRGPVRRATQLFPNEDFGEKKNKGIFGYVCVFDPTLEGELMERQIAFLTELLPMVAKRKRKIVLVCVKCDVAEEMKIRFGSNMSHYALKKTMPFFEVSARDSVNVEDAFFALISPPKKSKSTKNGRNATSGYLTYKEVIESRKGDLNRTKADYRNLLRQKVTSFSSCWSDVRPELEKEQIYCQVLHLAGTEGPEVVKTMFQNQLIEIKLAEANTIYGSTSKKLNKNESHEHQVYLSEAFRGHPDLGSDSLYDYVFSPSTRAGSPGPTVDDDTEILTEPSTPSSYRNTPDMSTHPALNPSANISPRVRSTTLPDIQGMIPPYLTYDVPRSLYDTPRSMYDTPPNTYDTPQTTYDTPRMMYDVPRMLINDTLSPSSQVSGHSRDSRYFAFTSPIPNGNPPPLPPRENITPGGTMKKNKDRTSSQQYLDKSKATLNSDTAEVRRLSSSMTSLLTDEGSSMRASRSGNLDAEPYLQPMELKKAMAELPPLPADFQSERNSVAFASMRVAGRSRPPLPNYNTIDVTDSNTLKSLSLEKRHGHRRSQSNPFILEQIPDLSPPRFPPRKPSEPAPPVPPRPSVQLNNSTCKSPPPNDGDITSPIESSLEFKPSHRKSAHVEVVSHFRDTFRNGDDEDDNASTVSGPFEEIETQEGNACLSDRPASSSDRSTSASIPQDLASLAALKGIGNDDYAVIADLPYMQMAPAPVPNSVKAGTFNLPLSSDDMVVGDHRGQSKTLSQVYNKGVDTLPSTPKRESQSSNASSGLLSWPRRKWKKQQTMSDFRHGTDSPSPPPPQRGSISTSQLRFPGKLSPMHEPRPLPPSPTKGLQAHLNNSASRKPSTSSQGSNIYEVIDENFVSRVRNRPSRQASRSDKLRGAEWAPPVDPKHWNKYLETVHKFFERPDIQQQWIETVKEAMPEIDADEVHPPYYKMQPILKESPSGMDDMIEAENEEEDEEEEETDDEMQSSPTVVIKPQATHDVLNEDHQIPITLHNSEAASSLPSTPVRNSAFPIQQSPFSSSHSAFRSPNSPLPSAPRSPHLSWVNSPLQEKRVASRDDLIEMMNQQLNEGAESTDSDSDEGESDSSDSESDSDINLGGKVNHVPKVDTISSMDSDRLNNSLKGSPILVHQTDLDMALDSVSVESDLTDSVLARSPQSNSAEEMEVAHSNPHTEDGVEEVHCVKPSQLLPRRVVPARRREGDGNDGSRNLSDSGISNCHSQTFEEGFSVQNNDHFESDL